MKTMRAKKRGAAGWCEMFGIGPGSRIEIRLPCGWELVTVTALGQSAILVRRKGCMEFAHQEITNMRLAPAAGGEAP